MTTFKWVRASGLIEQYRRAVMSAQEQGERAELARLKAKYEGVQK